MKNGWFFFIELIKKVEWNEWNQNVKYNQTNMKHEGQIGREGKRNITLKLEKVKRQIFELLDKSKLIKVLLKLITKTIKHSSYCAKIKLSFNAFYIWFVLNPIVCHIFPFNTHTNQIPNAKKICNSWIIEPMLFDVLVTKYHIIQHENMSWIAENRSSCLVDLI